jgi:hypothetical protein
VVGEDVFDRSRDSWEIGFRFCLAFAEGDSRSKELICASVLDPEGIVSGIESRVGLADHRSRAGARFPATVVSLADFLLMLAFTLDKEVLDNRTFSSRLFNPVEEDIRASGMCFMMDDFRSLDFVVLVFDDDSGNRSSSSLFIAANSADIRLRSEPSPKLSAL